MGKEEKEIVEVWKEKWVMSDESMFTARIWVKTLLKIKFRYIYLKKLETTTTISFG